MTDVRSFGHDAERCRGLGVLPSPLWGGVGGGGQCLRTLLAAQLRPPLPTPPPQGGREQTEFAARSCGETRKTERAMTDVLASKAATPQAVLTGVTADHTEGMSYLQTLPRRLVTLYLPLSLILFVLLFPFYWMAL